MPCIRALSLVVALLLGTARVAGAQTTSGPDVGSPIQPLKVAAITGDGAGDDLDFAAAARAARPCLPLCRPTNGTAHRPVSLRTR